MLSEEAKYYLKQRATQGNVLDKIEFEPENVLYGPDSRYFQITGIYEGALDEEFVIKTDTHEVNTADWLAEFYQETKGQAGSSWMVDLYEYIPSIDGDDMPEIGLLLYRVTDES